MEALKPGAEVDLDVPKVGDILRVDGLDGWIRNTDLFHKDESKSDGSRRWTVAMKGRQGARQFRVYPHDVIRFVEYSLISGVPVYERVRKVGAAGLAKQRLHAEAYERLNKKRLPHTCPVCDNQCPG